MRAFLAARKAPPTPRSQAEGGPIGRARRAFKAAAAVASQGLAFASARRRLVIGGIAGRGVGPPGQVEVTGPPPPRAAPWAGEVVTASGKRGGSQDRPRARVRS